MVRYKRIGYVVLNVTDVDQSAPFYRDAVGLQLVHGPDPKCRYLRCSDKAYDIVLSPGGSPGLKRVGFQLESEDQAEVLKSALDAGSMDWVDLSAEECEQLGLVSAVRCWEPATGCALDFYAEMKKSGETAYEATVTRIERLGHLVVRSPDFERSLAFFTETLNFKVSDYIGSQIAFMRCFPNPFHHSLGIGNGRGRPANMNHVNFMVSDVDDIGKAMWRLQKMGSLIVNGPGRHLPSGSMFLYFLDPDGITLEFSFGMEEFPELDVAREPRVLPQEPLSRDLWLGPVHERKAAVGAIEDSRPTTRA